MAVSSGFVGSSAKKETGKEFMSEARKELRLSPNGWMSEMIGKSTEVRYINTVNRTQASIHALMGSPTVANVYVFENTAIISAATQSGWALQTGAFPAGSTLKIINRGSIRGGGGNGGINRQNTSSTAGSAGGTALVLNFPTTIDNTLGSIWGGGGGGGGGFSGGGGGGAGTTAGLGGSSPYAAGKNGTATAGGAGGGAGGAGAAGGSLGAAGGSAAGGSGGGRGGYSVESNSNAVTWVAVGDRKGSVV